MCQYLCPPTVYYSTNKQESAKFYEIIRRRVINVSLVWAGRGKKKWGLSSVWSLRSSNGGFYLENGSSFLSLHGFWVFNGGFYLENSSSVWSLHSSNGGIYLENGSLFSLWSFLPCTNLNRQKELSSHFIDYVELFLM